MTSDFFRRSTTKSQPFLFLLIIVTHSIECPTYLILHSIWLSKCSGGIPSIHPNCSFCFPRSSMISFATSLSYANYMILSFALASTYPAAHKTPQSDSARKWGERWPTWTLGTTATFPNPAFQKSVAINVHSLAAHSPFSTSPLLKRTLWGGRNGLGDNTARAFHDEKTWNGSRLE